MRQALYQDAILHIYLKAAWNLVIRKAKGERKCSYLPRQKEKCETGAKQWTIQAAWKQIDRCFFFLPRKQPKVTTKYRMCTGWTKLHELTSLKYDTALIMEKNLQIYPLFRILPDEYATPSPDYWSQMNLTTPKKLRAKSSVWAYFYSDIRT